MAHEPARAHPDDDLVVAGRDGLHCPRGGFVIDPWRPVPVAVITHAHGDHARRGAGRYIAAAPGVPILRQRLGHDIDVVGLEYGESIELGAGGARGSRGAVRVSLHPAGHCLGSAQVRIEDGDRVAVVAGDYKRAPDPTCAAFEVIPCELFVTEATFALPVYRWDPTTQVIEAIRAWWMENRAAGRTSVLFCYALGKAQRLLAEIARGWPVPEPVIVHGALAALNERYLEQGVELAPTRLLSEGASRRRGTVVGQGALVLAPPSAAGSPWMRRFGPARLVDTAFASGWMRLRGIRRRRGYDRGFVISDHADWPDLLRTITATGARRVLCTHGYTGVLARYLREQGLDAAAVQTDYGAEDEDPVDAITGTEASHDEDGRGPLQS